MHSVTMPRSIVLSALLFAGRDLASAQQTERMSVDAAGVEGNGGSGSGVAISSDGRIILVGNMVEKDLQVFDWNGTTLKDSGHRIKLNGGSAAVRIADK